VANLTGAISQPDSTVALRAIGGNARAATFRVLFAPGFQQTICALDHLPPGEKFGPIGSVFLDNSANTQPLTITFIDTGAADIIPPGASSWMLAITGSMRFQLNSPCAVQTLIIVQALNVVVPPTGVQAVSGAVTISTGVLSATVALGPGAADAGTVHVAPVPVTITQTIVALTAADVAIIGANPARKYLLLENIGTGLASLNFGAVAVFGQGKPLSAALVAGDSGGSLERSGDAISQQAIHGICAAGVTTNICVLEGV
jgi:hypothetical protein